MEYRINSEVKKLAITETECKVKIAGVNSTLYAPWDPGEIFMSAERKRIAATMLKQLGRFPKAGDRCLEIGYGRLGWLSELIFWGMRENDLYGVELNPDRARQAQETLPNAELVVGNAKQLPWENEYFKLIIASTVFSSISDQNVRNLIVEEINRVLSPEGAFVWYDAAVNNPRNKNFKCITRNELKQMFPMFNCQIKSVTLAPPIARFVAKRSWTLATMLSAIPLLRTHLLAVFVKK